MSDGSTVEKLYQSNSPTGIVSLPNRFVSYEFTSIADSGGTPVKTAIKEYAQDKNGNMTSVKEYDYFSYSSVPRTDGKPTGLPSGASSNLKRISKTEFYNPTPEASSTTYNDADSYHLASSERLLRLAKSAEVQDASQTPKSRSEITYDYTNYDGSNTKAGNPTETKVWDSFKGGVSRSYSNQAQNCPHKFFLQFPDNKRIMRLHILTLPLLGFHSMHSVRRLPICKL